MPLDANTQAANPDQAKQQLERVLGDSLFRQAQRLSDLLRYLVETVLAGRQSELKEYVIGVEAFQRGPDFNPQVDNVVRVNAARLRSKLAEYYQSSGAADPVVIVLTKGSYVPSFFVKAPVPTADLTGWIRSVSQNMPVGREKELDTLLASFEAASNGYSQILAISGEAGIGKTTIANSFLMKLEMAEMKSWVLRGRCSERLSKAEPFLPFFECLEEVIQSGNATEMLVMMKSSAPAWFSRLEPKACASSQEHSLERFRRELVRFLKALSDMRPVVLFLDDLQWVDASSVDLLAYVSAHLKNLRLLLLAAYRPSAVLSAHPFASLKHSLERQGNCRELPIGLLSAADVNGYIHQLFPINRFPEEFCSAVYERTEGHPLFMCDMLRYLQDRDVITEVDGEWHLNKNLSETRTMIPSGAQNMIRLEIAQIAPSDRKILECAAVQGVTFDSAVISKALAIDATEIEERLLEFARAQHFIESCGESNVAGLPLSIRFRFSHVLYQNALYSEITLSRRAALSVAVAEALSASQVGTPSGAASEIALLFECGRDHDRASNYFLRAARHAIAVFAYPEAVLLCRRGIDNLLLLPESCRRDARELELSLVFGLAMMVTRGYAAPEVEQVHRRSRELCLRLNDLKHLIPVLWGIHTCLVNAGELVPSLELAQEMSRVAASQDDPEFLIQSLHATGTTFAFMGQALDARIALEQGIQLLALPQRKPRRSLFILDTSVTLHCMLARVLARLELREEALERAQMSLEVANNLEHPPSIAYATFWMGWVYHAREEFATACGPLETAMALSRKYGLPQFLEWSRILHGSCLAHLGKEIEGIAEMRLSVDNQLSMRCMVERPFCLTLLAEGLLFAGAYEGALKLCDEALAIAERTGGKSYDLQTIQIRETTLTMLKGKGASQPL
jgi:tetratricopeptide (TPR) repeat protein